MPKRTATPPPGDDEPKYLTICYPYPPHANMELETDRLALARWLACCMGTSDDLYAIFHKPSAPNMIIIEVRRDFEFRRLLGAHKWSEFVLSPGKNNDKITRIYFSTFPTGRAVEKAGWKRIFVADSWFSGFIYNNRFIKYPYPPTSHCDLPSEDQTGFTLCRPLPLGTFQIQAPAPPPIPVGSAGWVAQKGTANPGRNPKPHAIPSANHAQTAKPQMPASSSLAQNAVRIPGKSTSTTIPGVSNRYSSSSSSSGNNHNTSPMSRLESAAAAGGSSEAPSPSDNGSSEGMSVMGGNGYLAEGYFDSTGIEDEFGTLALHPTTNKDGTPLCPSHGVICKKGICRDYAGLLKKIEREKRQASFNEKIKSGPAQTRVDSNGFSPVTRGRGGGSRGSYRARGFISTRGRGSSRGSPATRGSSSGW